MPQTSPDSDPSRWVELYGDALYRFAYFRVSDRTVAEDLVQETFLAAMKGLNQFSGRSSVKTWLTGILKNKVVDHYRRGNRTTSLQAAAEFFEKEEGELFDVDGHWNYDNRNIPANWRPEQFESLDRKEFMMHFHACSRHLPTKTRQAFFMRELDGIKSDQICETLGITPQNLWTILHRARMALRQCLEKNYLLSTSGGGASS